jgi:predicted GNAT superfamily acetyltransferase
MAIAIRNVTPADLHTVLAMNEGSVPHVNRISIDQMQDFCDHAAYFRVAVADDVLVGFLVGLTPEADYSSPNFRWFCRNYPTFAYIDRVAVAENVRRGGLGSALYDDFEEFFGSRVPMLACEVNLRPANPASMNFHLRRGFTQVGSQELEAGKKEVAMLVKALG